ncbi:MAG: hypothetical protein FD123_3448 [Bacteroidetes bacterium]|nr:MAG: hypothetical protein FD123_3448 [Bacteroidota bacterium]
MASLAFAFVPERLISMNPEVKSMFGAHMVYLQDKMVFFLCDILKKPQHKGVWVCVSPENFDAALKLFSASVRESNKNSKGRKWIFIAAAADDFEEQVNFACDLVLRKNTLIGRTPV